MNASEKSEAIALHKAQGSVHVPHTTAEGTRKSSDNSCSMF